MVVIKDKGWVLPIMDKQLTVLVTGADGQLGNALKALSLGSKQINYIFASKQQLNISNKNSILDFITNHSIDFVINAAAYTNVNQAHAEADLAMDINSTATGILADLCYSKGIRLLHISTDYVFDGEKLSPYKEDDLCNPINTYGASKLAGEKAIGSLNQDAIIIRTSWVFSQWGNNFANSILKAASSQNELNIVNDQVGGPTWAMHLAQLIQQLLLLPAQLVPSGIYNFSGYPYVSWYDFARELFYRATDMKLLQHMPQIRPISSEQWPSPEPRPLNSCLDNSKLTALFYNANAYLKEQQQPLFNSVNVPFQRNWRAGIDAVLKAYSS